MSWSCGSILGCRFGTSLSSGTTAGIPIDDGRHAWLDVGLAVRRALLELIDWLRAERGYGFEQALALASVACELRLSQAVDLPSPLVSAALPLDVFA